MRRAVAADHDDPARMYLMQMGRIPLLSRAEEVDAAMKIDDARFLFRNSMLATDFMLRGAYDALQKVFNGELRLDRTIEVSVTFQPRKKPNTRIPIRNLLTEISQPSSLSFFSWHCCRKPTWAQKRGQHEK